MGASSHLTCARVASKEGILLAIYNFSPEPPWKNTRVIVKWYVPECTMAHALYIPSLPCSSFM